MNKRTKRVLLLALVTLILPLESIGYAASVQSVSPASRSASNAAAISPIAYTQIEAGAYYSVGLRADGSVWTWGRNLFGELGVLETNTVSSIVAPVRLVGVSDMISLSTNGYGYQIGLRADGTVWEWGSIAGVAGKSVLPRQVPSLTGITAICALNGAGYALKKDGTLWGWTREGQTAEGDKVVQVPGVFKWRQMTSNGGIAYALDNSGSLWAFGTTRADGSYTIAAPSRVAGLPAMQQISAYSDQMYGVDAAGAAWHWKVSVNYAEGNEMPSTVRLAGKPVKVYPKLKARTIAAGDGYALLLTQQGDVWTLGSRLTGKEGKVNGLTGIQSIAAGAYHSLAIDAKGQVWGWGANQWNETGTVRSTEDGMRYTPVRAQASIDIVMNGTVMPSAFPAVMGEERVMIPAKDAARALGGSLTIAAGDLLTNSPPVYTLKVKDVSAVFRLMDPEVEVNRSKVTLPNTAYIISGATMIPASLLKEMGFTVTWNASLAKMSIVTG